VATNEGDDAAFDHRDRVTAGPEVVADQGAGGVVVLGGAANRRWRGEEPGAARGGGGGRGRKGGFCGLRWDVSTVDSLDKFLRINSLIAGVRVVLRIGRG
jgi:hypothetical protein